MYSAAATATAGAIMWTITDPAFAPSFNAALNLVTLFALFFLNKKSDVARGQIKDRVSEVGHAITQTQNVVNAVHSTVAHAAIAAAAAATTAQESAVITKDIVRSIQDGRNENTNAWAEDASRRMSKAVEHATDVAETAIENSRKP